MLWQAEASVTPISITRQAAGACIRGCPGPNTIPAGRLREPRVKGPEGRWHIRWLGGRGLQSEAGPLPQAWASPPLLEAVVRVLPRDTSEESLASAWRHTAPVPALVLGFFFVRPQRTHLP